MEKEMIEAAAMIIEKKGLILGVSRKRDHSKFGLPGGKVEPGETHREAAIRETFEETGITVRDCEFLLSRADGNDVCSHCFVATDWEGTPFSSEEGIVRWCWKDELIDPNSAFPEFNRVAFELYAAKHPYQFERLEREVGWKRKFGREAFGIF